MNLWQPYLISIILGLLIGIEREKAHTSPKALGVRTFLLVSLLGAIAGGMQNIWFSIALTIFALGLILISYFNQTNSEASRVDRGLTTEFAAGIVFCLGFAAHQSPVLSVVVGPIVAVTLFSKSSLHRFTHVIKPNELQAALLLLLGATLIINLVPNAVVDPWGIFNPRKFGYLILTLAALEFSSYVLAKIIGEKRGLLIVGFLGGLVSSTAVHLSSARHAVTYPQSWKTSVCSSLSAKLAALIELLFIVGLVSPILLKAIIIPVSSMIIFGGILLATLSWRKEKRSTGLTLQSPLEWMGVLRLSLILGIILLLVSIAKLWLGDNAVFTLSFVTGLFELHGVSLANATMFDQNRLNIDSAKLNIALGIVASLCAKIAVSWGIERKIFARTMTAVFLSMITILTVTMWLTHW